MPGRDGTGPAGGGGGGRGAPKNCVCPACGASVPHQPGVPCRELKCPKCGATMVRGD
ncbi:MAG: hypothetical protein R6X14_02235 [bacterium]